MFQTTDQQIISNDIHGYEWAQNCLHIEWKPLTNCDAHPSRAQAILWRPIWVSVRQSSLQSFFDAFNSELVASLQSNVFFG